MEVTPAFMFDLCKSRPDYINLLRAKFLLPCFPPSGVRVPLPRDMHTAPATSDPHTTQAPSEHDPLLSRRPLERKPPTPLPKQLFVILFLCLAEPITCTVI